MIAPLYTTAILRLAADIPYAERLSAPHATAEKRSPVCGSRIAVDVETDASGRIVALGQEVRACALGQASAAIMGANALGRTSAELAAARDRLAAYLTGSDDPDLLPDLEIFAPARPHAARHASILLPFEAVAEAAEIATRKAAA